MEQHRRYRGPISELQGKMALTRPLGPTDWVLAQFDDMQLGDTGRLRGTNGRPFCFGWHRFKSTEFEPPIINYD